MKTSEYFSGFSPAPAAMNNLYFLSRKKRGEHREETFSSTKDILLSAEIYSIFFLLILIFSFSPPQSFPLP
jgi:hypothetical protein